MTGREKILRSDKLVKVSGYQASYKEEQFQVDKMKAMCFLLSAYQKRYSFLLKQLRERDKVGRDDYTVMTTSALDLLILIEGGIQGNQQSSTYENCRG